MPHTTKEPDQVQLEQSSLQRNSKRILMAGAQGALCTFFPGLSQAYAIYSSFKFVKRWFWSESPSRDVELGALVGFLFGLTVPEYLRGINNATFVAQASSRAGLAVAGAARSILASAERAFVDAGVRFFASDEEFEAYMTGTGINAVAHTVIGLTHPHGDRQSTEEKEDGHVASDAKHEDDVHASHEREPVRSPSHSVKELHSDADHRLKEPFTGTTMDNKNESEVYDEKTSLSQGHHATEKVHEVEQTDHAAKMIEHLVVNDRHDKSDERHILSIDGPTASDGCHVASDGCHTANDGCHIASDGCHTAKDGHHIASDGSHIDVVPLQTTKQGIHTDRDKAYARTNQYPDVDTDPFQSRKGPPEPDGVPPLFQVSSDSSGESRNSGTGASLGIDPGVLDRLPQQHMGTHATSATASESRKRRNAAVRRYRSKDKHLRQAIDEFTVDGDDFKLLKMFCKAEHKPTLTLREEDRVPRVRESVSRYANKYATRAKTMKSFAQRITNHAILLAFEEICNE